MSIVRSMLTSILASGVMPYPLLALPAALLSCQELDPAYCASHPGDVDCAGRTGIDAGVCHGDDQCMYPTPVCDIGRSMCVACTVVEPGSCNGATPVCGDDSACRGCRADEECGSHTCLADGACAAPLDVLYASPGGTDTAGCMRAAPCTVSRALGLIDGTKSTIHLDPGRYSLTGTLRLLDDVHLVGRDAVIERSAAAPDGGVVDLASGARAVLDHVTVQGGRGGAGFGVRCTNAALTLREVTVQGNAGPGVTAAGCALAISHARIAGNQGTGVVATDGAIALTRSHVLDNRGGGVGVTRASYDLENDVIAGNGDAFSLFGGVLITQISAPGDRVFAFNTVARNLAPSGIAGGVRCGILAAPARLTSSIVFDNAGPQVDGASCTWSYSLLGVSSDPGNPGDPGSADPLFVDPVRHDYHLQLASPARDAADPAATLAVDIDGDARPQGPASDMGADEIHEIR